MRPLTRGTLIDDPKTLLERKNVATSCAANLDLTMPLLIDELDDRVAKAYGAYPDRLYIIGKNGRVAYQGGPGPFGFRPDEMEEALKEVIAGKVLPKRLRL